jgi:hypothetical protein
MNMANSLSTALPLTNFLLLCNQPAKAVSIHRTHSKQNRTGGSSADADGTGCANGLGV